MNSFCIASKWIGSRTVYVISMSPRIMDSHTSFDLIIEFWLPQSAMLVPSLDSQQHTALVVTLCVFLAAHKPLSAHTIASTQQGTLDYRNVFAVNALNKGPARRCRLILGRTFGFFFSRWHTDTYTVRPNCLLNTKATSTCTSNYNRCLRVWVYVDISHTYTMK